MSPPKSADSLLLDGYKPKEVEFALFKLSSSLPVNMSACVCVGSYVRGFVHASVCAR